MLLRSYEIFIQNMDLISSRSRSNVLIPISLYPYIQHRLLLTQLRSSCLDIRCRCLILFRISSILRICSTCLLISLSILVAKIMILCVKRCRNHKKKNLKEKIMVYLTIFKVLLAKWQINLSSSIYIPFEPLWFDGDNKKPKIPKSFSRKCRKIPKSLLNDTNEIHNLS